MLRGSVRSRPRDSRSRTAWRRRKHLHCRHALLRSALAGFENNEKSIDCNTRMVMCYDNFATQMNQPITRVELPFGGKSPPRLLASAAGAEAG